MKQPLASTARCLCRSKNTVQMSPPTVRHLLYQPKIRASVPGTLLNGRQFPTPHASRPLTVTAAQVSYILGVAPIPYQPLIKSISSPSRTEAPYTSSTEVHTGFF
jgi:hypothetical protein